MSLKRGGLVAVAQGWGALVDGHASKCPLCGQTTSQRDIAHLPSRTGRDYRQIGRDKLQPEVAGREAKIGLSAEIRRNPTIEFFKIMKLRGWLKMNNRRHDADCIAQAIPLRAGLRHDGGDPGKALGIKVRQALLGFVRPFNLKKL